MIATRRAPTLKGRNGRPGYVHAMRPNQRRDYLTICGRRAAKWTPVTSTPVDCSLCLGLMAAADMERVAASMAAAGGAQ